MPVSKQRFPIALTALLGVCAATHAQNGFLDFSKIPGLDAQPSVTVDLNAAMIGFVAEATRASDPETATMLAGIRGIRVFVYESLNDRNATALQQFVDDSSGKLESAGWHRAVFVQNEDGKVRMYVKLGDTAAPSRLDGLTMMATDERGESVFITVDGQIDPAQLGRLAALATKGKITDPIPGFGAPPPAPRPNAPQ
jgi:hypothetical protein